jgi:biopolymer transport protein ExbD
VQFSTARRRRSTFSITPLVDVVFLMLVFFLLTSSFVRYRAIEMSFVETETVANTELPTMVFRIDRDTVTIDGVISNVTEIARTVMDRLSGGADLRAVVLVHTESPLQSLVTVVEAIREGGVDDIRIADMED